jgi:hypothetical protein
MRRKIRSPLGNASASPRARMAMYCAVHGPMPGCAKSAFVTACGAAAAANVTAPDVTARASVLMAAAREAITPTSSIGAWASCFAVGKIRSRPSPAPATAGEPKRLASRPAMVVAAATDTCWPRMARTESSNASQAPGVRMPGCRFTIGPSSASAEKCPAIAVGSAPRSNRRRTRSTMTGSARESGNQTARSMAGFAVPRLIWIVPVLPAMAMVRR